MVQLGQAFSVSGLLVFGTTTSLFAKIVYEIEIKGVDGEKTYFRKPWAMTSLMFLGMSFCLPLAYYQERKAKKRSAAEDPLLSFDDTHGVSPQRSQLNEIALLAIPTAFDLVATILMNIGLLYVTASVYQMMRGAEMLFAAFFAITFLGRKLNRYHALGVFCCVMGIALVGSSSLMSGEGSSTHPVKTEEMLLGMGLIITSQAVQAAQLTFEDFFMADLNISGIKIVGYEGLLGTVGTLLIMMPIAYFLPGPEGGGIHEDFRDTVVLISRSRALQVVLLVDMAALLMYNVSGMAVTGHLGAVFRTVLETMRTLFVWVVDLMLFYYLPSLKMGESWSVYSWLQAAGFVVLVTGTMVYRHGDHEAHRRMLMEAMALRNTEAPPEDVVESGPPYGMSSTPYTIGVTSPLAMAGYGSSLTSQAIDAVATPKMSFRATQTIVSGSYSRSLQGPGSYLSRSPWTRGGWAHGTPAPNHGLDD